jgi:Uma2 family endonuclease
MLQFFRGAVMENPRQHRMGRDEFRQWAEQQEGARYERVNGEPVAMAPERAIHARLKARVWQALDRTLRDHAGDCEALPDGMTVEVDADTDYEPDAVVNCGPPIPDDAIAAINPVIVVEVLSPGTRGIDTGAKLDGYFRVPSIVHYLIVLTARRGVIHHRRAPDGGIDTRILSSGKIELDPPGIAIDIDEIYAR